MSEIASFVQDVLRNDDLRIEFRKHPQQVFSKYELSEKEKEILSSGNEGAIEALINSSDKLTFSGSEDTITFSGSEDTITFSGSDDKLTFSGSDDKLTFSGSDDKLTFSGSDD